MTLAVDLGRKAPKQTKKTENSVCKVHLNKESKGDRDISLIKTIAFLVAM